MKKAPENISAACGPGATVEKQTPLSHFVTFQLCSLRELQYPYCTMTGSRGPEKLTLN